VRTVGIAAILLDFARSDRPSGPFATLMAMAQFELNQKAYAGEEPLLGDELYQAEREHIVRFLAALRAASTAEEFTGLQMGLIGRTKARQELAHRLRDAMDAVKSALSALATEEPKPIERLKATQHRLAVLEHQRRVSEALRWLLVTIGDGMAWKALGYDRGAITVLGQGDRVAHFADPAGFNAEINAIEALWNEGVFAIHNDLTTCLRHGDVTAIRPAPDADEREVELYEVKARRTPSEESPQIRRLERATRLINEGRIEQGDGSMLNFHRVPIPYRTHLANLRDLIPKARRDGYVARRLGDGMWIAIFYIPARLGRLEEMAEEHRETQKRLGWPDHEAAFTWSYGARRMRDRRYSFSALAPLSIFPFEAEDVADLMMGFLDAMVCVDGRRYEQLCAARGLSAAVATGSAAGEYFVETTALIGTRAVRVKSPGHIREQIQTELMTPENAIALTRALLEVMAQQPEGSSEAHLVVPSGERVAWEG
jgi:hypothetical protein